MRCTCFESTVTARGLRRGKPAAAAVGGRLGWAVGDMKGKSVKDQWDQENRLYSAADPPPGFAGEPFKKRHLIGLFRSLADLLVEVLRILANQNAPTAGLYSVENEGCGGRGAGRGVFKELPGPFGRERLQVGIGHL